MVPIHDNCNCRSCRACRAATAAALRPDHADRRERNHRAVALAARSVPVYAMAGWYRPW